MATKKTVFKKVEKYLGKGVLQAEGTGRGGVGGYYYFQHGDYVVTIGTREAYEWEKSQEDQVCSYHMRRSNDHTDTMTDYFAGSYYDNITQILDSLGVIPPKFGVGQLVRVKENKSNIKKFGKKRVGVPGLVVSVGKYKGYKIEWSSDVMNGNWHLTGNHGVKERLLELA